MPGSLDFSERLLGEAGIAVASSPSHLVDVI
jgi:hypothetical protein